MANMKVGICAKGTPLELKNPFILEFDLKAEKNNRQFRLKSQTPTKKLWLGIFIKYEI